MRGAAAVPGASAPVRAVLVLAVLLAGCGARSELYAPPPDDTSPPVEDGGADETHIYWSGLDQGIYKVPKAGGDPVEVNKYQRAWDMSVDEHDIYLTDGCSNCGHLAKVPKGGGEATVLVQEYNPGGVAIDGDAVYWAGLGDPNDTGAVRKLAKGGSSVVNLATGIVPQMVAVDETCVYFIDDPAQTGSPTGTVGRVHK